MTPLRIVLILPILLATPVARAVETHLGPVTITRAATLKGSYDDNIFLSATHTTASGIATFSHALGISYETRRTTLRAGYDIDVIQYDKLPGVNNAVNQEGTFSLARELGETANVWAGDVFKATNDPASSELVERTRRNQNDATVYVETGLGPDMFVGAEFHHTLHNYLNRGLGAQLNRKMVDVAPRVGYKVTEKLRLYAEGIYEKVGYESPFGAIRDNASTGGMAVATGEFTVRLKGEVGVGIVMRKYDISGTNLTNSVSVPSWNAAVSYDAPLDFTVTVLLSRVATEGFYNRYNVSMVNTVQVSRPMSKKVVASVFGMVVGDTYPDLASNATSTVKRKDTTIQGGLTVDYAARSWLVGEAGLLYRSRNSNLDVFDYADQVESISLTAKY